MNYNQIQSTQEIIDSNPDFSHLTVSKLIEIAKKHRMYKEDQSYFVYDEGDLSVAYPPNIYVVGDCGCDAKPTWVIPKYELKKPETT